MRKYDAIIIGSGPNGLAAAIRLQQNGLKTVIYEAADKSGGATRTENLTLPGFKHDVGSAIHPLAFDSPFFKTLPLDEFGLEWIHPEIPFAHPLAEGAIAAYKDVEQTAEQLGIDQNAYLKLFNKLLLIWNNIQNDALGPLRIPSYPLDFAKFGLNALLPASTFVNRHFNLETTKTFLYGAAAHSTVPLTNLASASFGLVLFILGHKVGWPFPKGGAINISKALLGYYQSIGGELVLNHPVTDLAELPDTGYYFMNLTPAQILKIKGTQFSRIYRNRLSRFRYGAGIFKIDWALEGPIPWLDNKCKKAGTVHLGYSSQEIEHSEKVVHEDHISHRPYVLMAQHSLFDDTRAPKGKHTAWAYIHVPNGNEFDPTAYIENQIEKAAPGFGKLILARSVKTSMQMQAFDANLVGGDVNGGKPDITQLFTRPVARLNPYATSDRRIFICSSSTPPGGGVHGMCGYHAAASVF